MFQTSFAGDVAYIFGGITPNGTLTNDSSMAYDRMLLIDPDNEDESLSIFKALVESNGHTISGYYDQTTSLTSSFLSNFDVVIFGLHQKQWSSSEKSALDSWIRAGGGIFIYSDSAAGGFYNIVGAQNTVGQQTVNNIISQYGMQVAVDQADGIKARQAVSASVHPLMAGRPTLEGEGVSPVAVDTTDSRVVNLIPYASNDVSHEENISIQNRAYSALAIANIGSGHVIVMFDRQPIWNNGVGSNIGKQDNAEILRRIVNFLVVRPTTGGGPPPPPATSPEGVLSLNAVYLLLF